MTATSEPKHGRLEVVDAPATQGRKPLSRTIRIGLIGVGIIIGIAILSRLWLPGGVDSFRSIAVDSRLLPPLSNNHIFGTDHLGRDVGAQLMRATSNTLSIVALGTALATVVGVTVGLTAVMLRGLAENVLVRFTDVIYAIPAVLLALVLAAKLGPSYITAMLALGFWFFPTIARVTRSAALSVRERAFIKAARTYGRSEFFITWRHILPNVASIILVQITVVIALSILVEAGLAFLGVSTQPPEPSWGRMLSEGQDYLSEAPWLAVIPGLAIVLTVLVFNMLGNGLRDRLDRRGHTEEPQ